MGSAVDLQRGLLSAAFCVAMLGYRGREPARFAIALLLGVGFAHVGWAALHAGRVLADPLAFVDPTRGFSVLFVPLGPCALGLASREPEVRRRFVASALRALPLALACARIGCLVAGCCGGSSFEFGGSGMRLRHPTALYESIGLVALHVWIVGARSERVFGRFALGFGLIRLVVEPVRESAPLGPPGIPVAWIAGLWSLLGLASLARARGIASLTRARDRRRPAAVCRSRRPSRLFLP